ncbi:unnamed protein product [Orchesella dallaii]|uniref:Peptidase M28 domain-containing protein n=1 Tax=Orchesella dallaii TaxID=48710 RepID=A0ABP1S3Z1_9HEXA
MAFKCLLIVSLIIVAASLEERPPGKRLIKYDMKEPAKWMTLEEINQLPDDKRKTLIDFTRRGSVFQPGAAQGRQHEMEHKLPDHALYKDTVRKLIPQIKKDRLKAVVKKLSSFHSRNAQIFFGATEAEGWLKNEIKTILADYKGSSSANFISIPKSEDGETSTSFVQQNMIVKIKGNGKDTKDQLVILGAHYDSIIGFNNFDPVNYGKRGSRSPGADDNASGCATLLEVLRILTQSGTKLKYNVEFHFYTAKEYEISGSWEVATHYDEQDASIIGMLNLDRIGYGNDIGVYGRNCSSNKNKGVVLCTFVKILVEEYVGKKGVDMNPKADGDGDINEINEIYYTDQTSWDNHSYPAVSLMEAEFNPHIHTERDTMEHVNFELVNDFTKVAIAFMVELGQPASSSVQVQMEWTMMGVSFIGMWLLY